jgi:release factor glutamine methyltransferase
LPRTIRQLLVDAAAKLAAALALDANDARLEAHYLLQHVLNKPRAWLLAHSEEELGQEQQAAYSALLQRRLAGEPLAYILGEREFFGLSFKVTPATLIPRPDTELLVEQALQRIPTGQACRVLDLGAGSGAIALSIAHARPRVEVTAVDASAEALAVARENAARLGVRNAAFLHGDWYAPLGEQKFDLIVSNPPYVASGDPHLQQGDLRFEPMTALASGADGLADIRRIVANATRHLEKGGWLLLEHGYDQAQAVRELLRGVGMAEVFSARDLAGIERVSGGRRSP